ADAFADGASDPFGAGTLATGPMTILAEYDPAPLVVPPPPSRIFGDDTIEPTPGLIYGSRKHVSSFQLTETGAVNRLKMYVSNPSRDPQVIAGIIYADAGGLPGTLRAAGPAVTVAPRTPADWITLPFSAPV